MDFVSGQSLDEINLGFKKYIDETMFNPFENISNEIFPKVLAGITHCLSPLRKLERYKNIEFVHVGSTSEGVNIPEMEKTKGTLKWEFELDILCVLPDLVIGCTKNDPAILILQENTTSGYFVVYLNSSQYREQWGDFSIRPSSTNRSNELYLNPISIITDLYTQIEYIFEQIPIMKERFKLQFNPPAITMTLSADAANSVYISCDIVFALRLPYASLPSNYSSWLNSTDKQSLWLQDDTLVDIKNSYLQIWLENVHQGGRRRRMMNNRILNVFFLVSAIISLSSGKRTQVTFNNGAQLDQQKSKEVHEAVSNLLQHKIGKKLKEAAKEVKQAVDSALGKHLKKAHHVLKQGNGDVVVMDTKLSKMLKKAVKDGKKEHQENMKSPLDKQMKSHDVSHHNNAHTQHGTPSHTGYPNTGVNGNHPYSNPTSHGYPIPPGGNVGGQTNYGGQNAYQNAYQSNYGGQGSPMSQPTSNYGTNTGAQAPSPYNSYQQPAMQGQSQGCGGNSCGPPAAPSVTGSGCPQPCSAQNCYSYCPQKCCADKLKRGDVTPKKKAHQSVISHKAHKKSKH